MYRCKCVSSCLFSRCIFKSYTESFGPVPNSGVTGKKGVTDAPTTGNYISIVGTTGKAHAALKDDGSITVWGDAGQTINAPMIMDM